MDRSDIGNNYVYVIVDEATDPMGLAVVNLLIGKLDGTPSKSYVVACKELESTNYETICQFINSSLKIFSGKRAFLKAPPRINKYRTEMPGIPLPSEPIITRWEDGEHG
ncbi:Hypothetical protein CINCED_3A018556 [Cinara cedri]|uniref:DUF4371 domain-containing protein n=1 Tax=Cinara cedri TaxID=506608 RepID=A0A5E4NDU6_9HEMI|nr:Hypothetical protein CINCED_3A018556 [Cinara cedri]